MKLKFITSFSLLLVVGCSSEYSPDELEISSKGAFVERGTNSLIDGTFVVEKATGEFLQVGFVDGLPYGDVEMRNEKGEVVLKSNFVNQTKQKALGQGVGFINKVLEEAGELTTKDYLDLFEDFSEYDGNYLEIDQKNRKKQGVYNQGKKIGRWQGYCENGQLESDRSFKEFENGGEVVIKKIDKEQQLTCDGNVLLMANRDAQGRLQGEYIENYSNSLSGSYSDPQNKLGKPLQKYIRNYKDGEFDGLQKEFSNNGFLIKESNYKNGVLDGLQKEYDVNGKIKIERNFKNSIKDGEEKIYSFSQNFTTKEITHWLSEIRNYSEGKLNGSYKKFDHLNRPLKLGHYLDDQPVGLWETNNYSGNTKSITDYNASNFTLDKAKPFKGACYLPEYYTSQINWSKNRNASLDDCEYYIEKGLVDINKKIALDQKSPFRESNHWTYPAVVATPAVYEYMKSHGLKTRVADGFGRTRLHFCIAQFRRNATRSPRCTMDQLFSYMDDVDLNSVSNVGTLFHQIAEPYGYMRERDLKVLVNKEKKIIEGLLNEGANVNKLNHQNKTALMTAIENENYHIAEILIEAGASIESNSVEGKNALGYLFLNSKNKLKNSELNEDASRVLAKVIALGVNPNAPVLKGKTIQALSEQDNKLFHIQTLKNAVAMSKDFGKEFEDKIKINAQKNGIAEKKLNNETKISNSAPLAGAFGQGLLSKGVEQSDFVDAKKSLISDPTGSENTVEQVKLLEQPKEEVRNNVELLLEEVQNIDNSVVVDDYEVSDVSETTDLDNTDEASKLLKEQADFLVAQANEHISSYRLKTPKANSALASLEQLIKIDPANSNIPIIEKSIGEKYLALANKKIKEGKKSAAQGYLNSASEFITDEAVLVDYQARVEATKKYTPPPIQTSSTAYLPPQTQIQSAALTCDPVISISGIPLIGGQLFTAKQLLTLSPRTALIRSESAVRLTYNNVVVSSNEITYEQPTSTRPIKFTLSIKPNGNYSQITIKAKSPTGIVLKKSGYRKGFCDLIEKL